MPIDPFVSGNVPFFVNLSRELEGVPFVLWVEAYAFVVELRVIGVNNKKLHSKNPNVYFIFWQDKAFFFICY